MAGTASAVVLFVDARQGRSCYDGPGYANGTVTPACIAFNGFGALSEISSVSAFIFNGGFFTAAVTNGLDLRITGFSGVNALFN